ncbi:Thermoresistant gluconokinase [bioreactor metagenome]|uniref:gluconokinase n=1 Tax=bioreactor metagenome TaxID=1076179 RepID=A0A645IUW2_9ZZZZ
MSAGIPLTDDDRAGWLDSLAELLKPHEGGQGVVLTCSALRRKYRNRLRAANPRMGFVFLDLSYDEALERVRQRPGHFFSPALVADQFATLERPVDEPDVLTLNATHPIAGLQKLVVNWAEHMQWTSSHAQDSAHP